MHTIVVCLLLLGIVGLRNASGQENPEEEMKLARAIADKLNSLTKPKASLKRTMSAAGGIGRKSSALSTGPQYIDLMLIVDSSGSIGTRPFEDAKDATETVVDFINSQAAFSPSGSRAALIEFSSPKLTNVVLSFSSKNYQYAYDVKNLINNLRYDSGPSTATKLALSKAKTDFQRYPNSKNANVIWFFSDGKSNTGGSPVPVANELKTMGVTICSMAIGKRVNMKEINDISSDGCVYKFKDTTAYKRTMTKAFRMRRPSATAPVLKPGFFSGINFS